MKIPRFTFLAFACGCLLTGLIAGCGGAPKEKVDVQAQIQNLKSPDTDTRVNACVELAKAGPDAAPAIQPLIAALKDSDSLVRRLAAYALGEIGEKAKEAIPALKQAMGDRETDVITSAVNAIRAIDPEQGKNLQPPPNVTN